MRDCGDALIHDTLYTTASHGCNQLSIVMYALQATSW